jgi:alpha-glucoside transport system permease protein
MVFAVMASRVRYEAAAKSALFIPMAISFVAASVIWKFMYDFNPKIGTINAVMTRLGLHQKAWLTSSESLLHALAGLGPTRLTGPLQVNNLALVLVGVWMWSGFATVVLSAGLKSIPEEILEAARVDGATEFQIFRRVILPMLKPTVAVVATTLVIQALKIFDLIWVMTGGRNGTHVVATLFYQQTFVRRQFGLGAALAVVLFLAVLPIMAINVRQFEAGDGQT